MFTDEVDDKWFSCIWGKFLPSQTEVFLCRVFKFCILLHYIIKCLFVSETDFVSHTFNDFVVFPLLIIFPILKFIQFPFIKLSSIFFLIISLLPSLLAILFIISFIHLVLKFIANFNHGILFWKWLVLFQKPKFLNKIFQLDRVKFINTCFYSLLKFFEN